MDNPRSDPDSRAQGTVLDRTVISADTTREKGRFVALDDDTIKHLRDTLSAAMRKHSPKGDSFYHNGGTVLALAATGAATIIPTSHAVWAKIAAAIATFIIALARALDFGGRWRWHIEMRNAYQGLIDRTDELNVLPDADRLAAIKTIYDRLEKLRVRENGIPGAGGTAAANS